MIRRGRVFDERRWSGGFIIVSTSLERLVHLLIQLQYGWILTLDSSIVNSASPVQWIGTFLDFDAPDWMAPI